MIAIMIISVAECVCVCVLCVKHCAVWSSMHASLSFLNKPLNWKSHLFSWSWQPRNRWKQKGVFIPFTHQQKSEQDLLEVNVSLYPTPPSVFFCVFGSAFSPCCCCESGVLHHGGRWDVLTGLVLESPGLRKGVCETSVKSRGGNLTRIVGLVLEELD